ncbi:MAG: iron-only hydrogenase system regulator [Christensenellaceae bacterium]|jgi:putative iron-only hydrogenase system regulator|nr:iron-only hydrogenase system regulator [Christensenellaceae bacterium]
MEKRLGFVGIVVEDLSSSERVNHIIGDYMRLVRGRMGIPDQENKRGVITLIIEGSNDEIGAFTGKLGALPGVSCKSLLAAKQGG